MGDVHLREREIELGDAQPRDQLALVGVRKEPERIDRARAHAGGAAP
jgi:hypothetical protein